MHKIEKFFWGVIRHKGNLPGRNTKKKSFLIDFWLEMTLQITWNDVKAPKKCENNASWSRFCVKNMRNSLFLDVFNEANFKYTPKKVFQMCAKSASCGQKVQKNASTYGHFRKKCYFSPLISRFLEYSLFFCTIVPFMYALLIKIRFCFCEKCDFLTLWEMRKSEKILVFFSRKMKYLINKVCAKVTQAWKIVNYPNKRKMEGSKRQFFGKLFAKMPICMTSHDFWIPIFLCALKICIEKKNNAPKNRTFDIF